MTRPKIIILTLSIVVVLGIGGYLLYRNYSVSSKYDYSVKGSAFKINGPHSGAFAFLLEVTNNFETSGTLEKYALKVSVNGTDVADIVALDSVYLQKGVPTPLTIAGTFDPLFSFKTLANFQTIVQAFTKPNTVDIRIYGTFDLKIKGLPINGLPIDVNLTLLDFLPAQK